jgi:hypothetical protein
MVLVLLAFNKDTVIALYVARVWVAILVAGYVASRSHHVRNTRKPAAAGTYPRKRAPRSNRPPQSLTTERLLAARGARDESNRRSI